MLVLAGQGHAGVHVDKVEVELSYGIWKYEAISGSQ